MRVSTVVMIGFAVLFGLLAVFIAQSWLNSQAERRAKNLEAQQQPVATQTLVVAARPLRFGNDLSASVLKEMPWPENAIPQGAFTKISQLISGQPRVVLTAIETNEPVLASKVTGPGQRATLSAVLDEGMKAVTIRVTDVAGVAGFVLPGDRVDVALTRQLDKGEATADVILQNVRVLAIDQKADERADKPAVAKAVTLEVETDQAQKIALASSIGTLSLLLRRAGEATTESTQRVTLTDLFNVKKEQDARFTVINVTRATERQQYSVPVEGADRNAVAAVEGRQSLH